MLSSTVILISQDPGLIETTKQWAENQSIKIKIFSPNEWESYVHRPITIKESFQTENTNTSNTSKIRKSVNSYKKDQTPEVLPTSSMQLNLENPSQQTKTQTPLNLVPTKTQTPMGRKIQTMNELENHAIQQAILEFHGNLTEAARALGIGRATLYRKVKQYNIDLVATRKKIVA